MKDLEGTFWQPEIFINLLLSHIKSPGGYYKKKLTMNQRSSENNFIKFFISMINLFELKKKKIQVDIKIFPDELNVSMCPPV